QKAYQNTFNEPLDFAGTKSALNALVDAGEIYGVDWTDDGKPLCRSKDGLQRGRSFVYSTSPLPALDQPAKKGKNAATKVVF
ncbi:MAG: hypothetical protein ACE5FF_12850, partial [Saprospiraceae bacterium]